MTPAANTPPMATPRVAAGALFTDGEGRILMVRPTYKSYWDIPGGYVEPGESPLAACVREVQEELSLTPPIGPLLVVDWAPAPNEGDKLLFVFDGGTLSADDLKAAELQADEIAEIRYIPVADLDNRTVPRLARRLKTAASAKAHNIPAYCEHGVPETDFADRRV